MTVQIDSFSDDWSEVARKIKEEFDVKVVSIQAGEPGKAYGGNSMDPDVSFRELIGTIEFWKAKCIQDHRSSNPPGK